MADILLQVGIDISSLKVARAQIGAELKSWKFPEAEKAEIVDKKQLSEARKAVRDLGKDIVQVSKAAIPEEELERLEKQTDQTQKLSKVTSFYKAQTDALGPSISAVRAELNAYLHAEQSGTALTEQEVARKKELIDAYTKLDAQQRTLLHGLNPARLLLWAVGWTFIYSAMRTVQAFIGEIIVSITQVNEALNVVRVANLETAKSFDQTYATIRKTIYDVARDSLIAAKDLAAAYKTLTFEGAKAAMATEALVHVRRLMTITGEKEGVVSQALIETYGLFKDKILGATTESEKLARISDLLATLFTKAHVSLSEYQQIMSFIGVTAADVVPSFDYLVKLMVYADNVMLQGRRAGMALMQVLVGLTEDTKKLQDVGIPIKYGEVVDVLKVLRLIKEQTVGLNEEAKKDLLRKMFKGPALELILKLLKETDLTLASITASTEGVGKAQEDAMKRSHFLAVALKTINADIAYGLSESFTWLNKIITNATEMNRLLEEEEMRRGTMRKDEAYLKKESEERLAKAVAAAKAAREEAEKRKVAEEGVKSAVKETKAAIEEQNMASIKIVGTERNKLDLLGRALELRKLETVGASLTLITQEKIETAIMRAVGWIEDETKRTEAITALRVAQGKSIEDIYKTVLLYTKDQQTAEQYVNDIIEARSAIQLKMFEEIKSLADEIESKTVDFVKNMMTGTANVKDFFQSIVDVYRETFAQQIVQMFGEKTGIFAGMAAAFMSPLQRAHYSGVQSAVPLIVQAHIDGITAGMAGVQVGGVAPTAAKPAGGISGFMQNISAIFGGGAKVPTAPTATVAPIAAAGGATQVLIKPEQAAQTSKLAAAGKAAGQALGAAAAIYGGVQGIMAQKGAGRGMGALGGAISGAMAGAYFGPWGMAIGAVVGGIYGAITGGKKARAPEPEIRTQTLEIKSAIQISNKELQLINRNITGMRRDWEGYIMPRSQFFAERLGVEERFNLSRSRGLL